ncbi:MAG: hypothetical protein ACTHN8_17990 [Angustibacter sp.]
MSSLAGDLTSDVATLRSWPTRRWLVAATTAIVVTLVTAIPTDLIDTPVFGREVPPTAWAWPALVVSSALAGLLTATYVASAQPAVSSSERRGLVGGLLTYFAVGCPVCNKLVLLALGASGAMRWFAPVQPVLQVAAVALLAWALQQRLRGERFCPSTFTPPTTTAEEPA